MSWIIDWSTPYCDDCDSHATHRIGFSFGNAYLCRDCLDSMRTEITAPTECDFCGEEIYDPEYVSEAYLIRGYTICEDCIEERRI